VKSGVRLASGSAEARCRVRVPLSAPDKAAAKSAEVEAGLSSSKAPSTVAVGPAPRRGEATVAPASAAGTAEAKPGSAAVVVQIEEVSEDEEEDEGVGGLIRPLPARIYCLLPQSGPSAPSSCSARRRRCVSCGGAACLYLHDAAILLSGTGGGGRGGGL
jgi:hypothetical protein